MTEKLQIGRVIKPHGVRGEIVVDITTDTPEERFILGGTIEASHRGKEFSLTILSKRYHQGRLLLRCEEIADRTEAEKIRGARFYAPARQEEDEDSYYDHELIGLHVLSCGSVDYDTAYARAYDGEQPEPQDIGKIIDVSHTPAGVLLHIMLDSDSSLSNAGHEVLVPFKHAIVPIVDLDNEAIVITPPEGLLDL